MVRRWRKHRYRSQERWTVPSTETSASRKARSFVLREFFDLDRTTMKRVIRLYGREYGEAARRYFEATFEKWRRGEVEPRRETQDRFLHCVPRFLPTAKQFAILSFYIPEYMKQLTAASRVHRLTVDALPAAYSDASNKCRETAPKLDWFIRGVFSDEELAAFTDVARYTVLDRLHRSYAAVRLDLATVIAHLENVDAMVAMRYRLDELGGVVEIEGAMPPMPERAFELPPVPELVVRHSEEYKRLLLDHHCEMVAEDDARVARHAVAKLDFSILHNAIASVSGTYTMDSNFEVRGAGGTFEGTVSRKNVRALWVQLFGRMATASVCTGALVVGIVAAFMSEDLRGLAFCGMWGVLVAIPALWTWVLEKHREVRDYERGQAKRFAEIRS